MSQVVEIAAGISTLVAALTIVVSVVRWGKRITEGVRCQLRSEMLRTYYRHREDRVIRQYEFENFAKNYEAYKALSGNSFIEKIAAEVREWEVVS